MLSGADWRAASAEIPRWAFGDSPALANELGALVISGRKTATTGLLREYEAEDEPLPRPGERHCILDGRDEPLCIIEITEVTVRPFGEVDEDFARDEGEGDLSLRFWRAAHMDFFARHGGADDTTPLVCQRFRVLHVFSGAAPGNMR